MSNCFKCKHHLITGETTLQCMTRDLHFMVSGPQARANLQTGYCPVFEPKNEQTREVKMSNCFKCKHLELRDDGLFDCIEIDGGSTYDPEDETEMTMLIHEDCDDFEPKVEDSKEPEKHNCKDCTFHKVVVACGSYSRHEEIQCSHKEIGNPLDYTIENDCIFFEAPKPQDLPGRAIMDGKEIDPVFTFETIDGELKQTAGEPMVSGKADIFGTMIPTEPGYYGIKFKGELETMEVFHRGISGDVCFIFNTVDTDDDVYDAQEIADDFINGGILKIGARIDEPKVEKQVERVLPPVTNFPPMPSVKPPKVEEPDCDNCDVKYVAPIADLKKICTDCKNETVDEPACPFCGHTGSHNPPVHHICNACKCWFTPETAPKVEEPKPSKAFDWLCEECKVAAKSGGAISLCRNCMSTYEALEPEPCPVCSGEVPE